jgi:hypothetical protein
MSTPPNRPTTALTPLLTCCSSVTSIATPMATPPYGGMGSQEGV